MTLAVPSGWAQPAAAAFGPIAPGASKTVDVGVSVPEGTPADSYTVRATARAEQGTARATTTIQVIGDTIEFTPGTDAEKPWLVDPDGSQLDGAIHDGNGRFADNGSHFTYRFDIPAGVTGGKLTLEIGNEYLVSVSSDDQTYREVLRETSEEHDLNNLDPPHELDLNTLLGGSRTLYVRIGDSFPQDGWGGWLGHLKLELTRG